MSEVVTPKASSRSVQDVLEQSKDDRINAIPEQPSLRDHFAMHALGSFQLSIAVGDNLADGAAVTAYKLADAMLKAREAK